MNWPVGLGGKGNEGVTGLVKQTPNSIGYVELIYAVQNKLAYGAVQNAAGRFLKGDSQAVESVTSTGILAKILDSIDGNMGFHFFVTEWIKSGKQELPVEMMQRGFVKTFEQQRTFRTQLATLPAGLSLSVATANQILDHQAHYIMLVWNQIPEEKIPQPVLDELIKLQQELEVVLD